MALASKLISQLREIFGSDDVLTKKEDLIPYSFDGTAALNQMPGCVVFATDRDQVVAALKLANDTKTPTQPRPSLRWETRSSNNHTINMD